MKTNKSQYKKINHSYSIDADDLRREITEEQARELYNIFFDRKNSSFEDDILHSLCSVSYVTKKNQIYSKSVKKKIENPIFYIQTTVEPGFYDTFDFMLSFEVKGEVEIWPEEKEAENLREKRQLRKLESK